MPSLDMEGPYPLRPEAISACITVKAPGNFAIGHLVNNRFTVLYVGRGESNLPKAVQDMVGRHKDFRLFKFSYAVSAAAAFQKHCRHYHEFSRGGKLLNKRHPESKIGLVCPYCE